MCQPRPSSSPTGGGAEPSVWLTTFVLWACRRTDNESWRCHRATRLNITNIQQASTSTDIFSLSYTRLFFHDGARWLKVGAWGTRKTGLNGGLLRAPRAQFWRGSSQGPSLPLDKKLNLGLEEMQFYDVLRVWIWDHVLSNHQNIPPYLPIPPHPNGPTPPSLFLCRFGQITRPIFSKSGEVRTPRLSVARPE